MLISKTTNRAEQDYIGVKTLVEHAYREALGLRDQVNQLTRGQEDCEKKLQVVDTIRGLQGKFEQMFQLFLDKCEALHRKHDELSKDLKASQEDSKTAVKKFQEMQKAFDEIKSQFEAAQAVGKNQVDRIFDVHNRSMENLKKEWQSGLKSLSEKLAISPKEVFDQNENHNAKLQNILEQNSLMNDENRKLKICFRILENRVETLLKKGA